MVHSAHSSFCRCKNALEDLRVARAKRFSLQKAELQMYLDCAKDLLDQSKKTEREAANVKNELAALKRSISAKRSIAARMHGDETAALATLMSRQKYIMSCLSGREFLTVAEMKICKKQIDESLAQSSELNAATESKLESTRQVTNKELRQLVRFYEDKVLIYKMTADAKIKERTLKNQQIKKAIGNIRKDDPGVEAKLLSGQMADYDAKFAEHRAALKELSSQLEALRAEADKNGRARKAELAKVEREYDRVMARRDKVMPAYLKTGTNARRSAGPVNSEIPKKSRKTVEHVGILRKKSTSNGKSATVDESAKSANKRRVIFDPMVFDEILSQD